MRLFHFSLLFTFITGFNTSEEDPDASQIPYTDSDSDLASRSLDGSTGVTRLPGIFGFRIAHTLRTASVGQGGGYSGSGDKSRLSVVPQESTHNGQEKAGTVISDLVYTATLSLTDSTLSFTEKSQASSLSSAETQWPGPPVSALTTGTSAYSNTDPNTLPEKVPRATGTYSNILGDTDEPLGRAEVLATQDSKIFQSSGITVMSSAGTVRGPRLTILGNGAPITEDEISELRGFRVEGTDGGAASVMTSSSSSYTASEGRTAARHAGDTLRTDRVPHSEPLNPDLSVTHESNILNDSVSGPQASEVNSVAYTGDGVMEKSSANTDTSGIEVNRTNRSPRSTHINENVSNHTNSALFDDPGIVTEAPNTSGSYHQIEASTLSHNHLDASENGTTAKRKSTEYYSDTLDNTNSPNTDSPATDSATTQTSHTTHSAHSTVPGQTTDQQTRDANAPRTSSEILTQTDWSSSPVPSTRHDFTPASASYSPHALGHADPTDSSALQTSFLSSSSGITTRGNDPTTALEGLITAPYHTTSATTQSSTDTEVQTPNDQQSVAVTSDSNNLSHVTTHRIAESIPMTVTHHTSSTSRNDPATPTSPNPVVTPLVRLTSPSAHMRDPVSTSTPPANMHTRQTTRLTTTTLLTETPIQNHPTSSRNTSIVQQPDTTTTTTTTTQQVHTLVHSQPGTHTPVAPVVTQTSSRRTYTTISDKDWSQKGRVFITEDQPALISVETFQVLLQVMLEENSPPYAGLVEVEPFLENVAGYQSQHVTWHSGPVLQSVVTFRTAAAVSWLIRAKSLLQEAGLEPLPTHGLFVSGIRVKNITVGGLHSDACSWAFSCPSDFYCVASKGNFTCRSVCHSEYCNNHGICVHRSGQQPLCQCPVGEDFWFMGQRCDLRMTQQRLAGVCFGVLAMIATLMGLLAYLAVQRFKKTLIQAKAEQTQSSYRRFNHFDELSARFWRRSWPGSEDSLDNTAFSRSDELLHMRALDRACCYHDDTLSIASTYPDSVTRLNTVYAQSSQYHWDMSTCSLADGVIDSGKASDLSVCSWPIEPIQWTPFPLLQQLRNANTVTPSRPRSYCEGMELVGLEKSRTA